ncbi:hypothetical protein R6Q59_029282 [Mikania micrantha]
MSKVVGLRASGISPTDAHRRLSSVKNQLHGSLQTICYKFNKHQHVQVQPSLFSMKIFEPKPLFQTWSMSTSKLRAGGSEIEQPEVGVAVFIINNDNKILIGRRRSLYVAANTYGLPAGHLELGESYEECAAREVKEETGLDIKNIELLSPNNIYYDAMHLNVTYMRAHLSDPNQTPQNIEPDKCEGWEWYDLNNLPEPMFEPLREMLQGGFDPFTSPAIGRM